MRRWIIRLAVTVQVAAIAVLVAAYSFDDYATKSTLLIVGAAGSVLGLVVVLLAERRSE